MRPLGLPLFRRLLTAYAINETGDSIALVALALLVYGKTQSAAATTALLLATRVIPAALAPLLVARIDRAPPNRVLCRLYLAEGAVFAALALLSEAFWLPAVLALGLLDGTLALAGRAMIRSAIASELMPLDLLREGNALVNVAFALGAVGGAALGGVLVAGIGVAAALQADALSFVIIAAVLLGARGLVAAQPRQAAERLLARFAAGLRFAGGDRRVRLLLAGQGLALVLFTMITPIEVVYAEEVLGVGELGFGILLATWGAGIVLGSGLYIAGRSLSLPLLVAVSTLAVALAYVGMSATSTFWVACALSVLGGAGNGVQVVAVMTALQRATPPELQARTVALLESLAAAAPGVGYLIGGTLTAASSPTTAYAVAGWGLLGLVAAAGAAVLVRPRAFGVARPEPREPEPADEPAGVRPLPRPAAPSADA